MINNIDIDVGIEKVITKHILPCIFDKQGNLSINGDEFALSNRWLSENQDINKNKNYINAKTVTEINDMFDNYFDRIRITMPGERFFILKCFNGNIIHVANISEKIYPEFMNRLSKELDKHKCELIINDIATKKTEIYNTNTIIYNVFKKENNHA